MERFFYLDHTDTATASSKVVRDIFVMCSSLDKIIVDPPTSSGVISSQTMESPKACSTLV